MDALQRQGASVPTEGHDAAVLLPEIADGLRVRLRKARADGWLQPLRRFAETGREATVTSVGKLTVRVEFDVKRKGSRTTVDHPHVGLFWRDYEPA